jgi:hypothetical protein
MNNLLNIIAIISIGTIVGLGCAGGSEDSPTPAKAAEKPLPIDAKALTKEYDDNELAADGKYRGKLLAVSGKISDISETFGSVSVSLEGHEILKTVMCTFQESEKQKVAALKKGAQVTLVGTGDGSTAGLYVGLENCVVPEQPAPSSNSKPRAAAP